MSTATSHAKPGRFARIRRTRKPAPAPQEPRSHPYPETSAGDSTPIAAATERALREPVTSAARTATADTPPPWWDQPGFPLGDQQTDSTATAAETTTADPVLAPSWVSADLANARPGTAPALMRDAPPIPVPPLPLTFLRRALPGGPPHDDRQLFAGPAFLGTAKAGTGHVAEVALGEGPDGQVILAGNRRYIDTLIRQLWDASDTLALIEPVPAAAPPPPAELAAVTAEVAPAEGEQDASQPGADLEPEGGEAA